jgi:hypothetical protein
VQYVVAISFKECLFFMRDTFVLKCHLNVIRNKMNTETLRSEFHAAVGKPRFLFINRLNLERSIQKTLYLCDVS